MKKRLLYDENMPKGSHQFLIDEGYDVRYVTGEIAGISDKDVIALAVAENRLLVTFDSDFGELVSRDGLKIPGLLFFRWASFTVTEPGEYLHQLFEENEIVFKGYFTVINRSSIRQRPLPPFEPNP